MLLDTANTTVLHSIASLSDETILGFLPIPENDVESILASVQAAIRTRGSGEIISLLDEAPAATAYAMVVAASRTLTEGGQFWPALVNDLGLNVAVQRRQGLAEHFMMVCDFLGMVSGTLEKTRFIIAAPFIFQAGILHYWRKPLADALRQTLRSTPAPDLEDERAMRFFVGHLLNHIHGQNLLCQLLKTPVGTLLCRRLIRAYVTDHWEVLPVYLQGPLREAFSEIGRGAVLRSPYVAFDEARREMVIVLPAQSSSWASESSVWQINDRRYSGRRETRVPTSDLDSSHATATVGLRHLLRGASDQKFNLSVGLGAESPFRIFRRDTEREKRIPSSDTIELPVGAYVVAMAAGVATNDEECVIQCDGFRLLEFDLRPGDNPLTIHRGSDTWTITPLLQAGFYLDRGHTKTVQLEGDDPLHYGDSLGLVAYFPTSSIEHGTAWTFRFTCVDASLDVVKPLPPPVEVGSAYSFDDSLKGLTDDILARLSPGIHKLEITLSHSRGTVSRSLWYWRGLTRISDVSGFLCHTQPLNIDYSASRGVYQSDVGLAFETQYHAPFVLLVLRNTRATLKLPHAGVKLSIFELGSEWEDEPNHTQALVVSDDDKRLVRLRAGGFQRWTIRGNDRELAFLDAAHQVRVLSLSGIAHEMGGAGRVCAVSERGRIIPLATLARPLLASTPLRTEDHGRGQEIWTFEMPKKDLCGLAVILTNLTDEPDAPASDPIPIVQVENDVLIHHETTAANENIVIRTQDTPGRNGAHSDVGDALPSAEHVRSAGADTLRVEVLLTLAQLKDELWTLDFVRRGANDDDWLPLQCKEVHGASSMRLIASGTGFTPEEGTWWRRLRQPKATTTVTVGQLQRGLVASRHLLACKYPGSVWYAYGTKLENLPTVLSQQSVATPASGEPSKAMIWWTEGAAELVDYASSDSAPVARQFLFGCRRPALCLPRSLVRVLGASRSASPVLRSLDIPAQINAAGGLKNYILQGMHEMTVDENLVFAYDNFQKVDSGRDVDFRDFSLNTFLNGVAGGKPGLGNRTEELNEQRMRLQVTRLLGPEHLLASTRALNRRCRPFATLAKDDIQNPLTSHLSSLESLYHGLETIAPTISSLVDWDLSGHNYWMPPLLDGAVSQKVAGLTWSLAAATRLTAHGRLSEKDFARLMGNLFTKGAEKSENVFRRRLCMLLSLGPELFAFYFGLFDLLFVD